MLVEGVYTVCLLPLVLVPSLLGLRTPHEGADLQSLSGVALTPLPSLLAPA